MTYDKVKAVSVLGAGVMGQGIAQSFIMGGYPVYLYDISSEILDVASSHIADNLKMFSKAGIIEPEDIEACQKRLQTSLDLKQSVSQSDLIIESAPEDAELKRKLFKEVETFCSEDHPDHQHIPSEFSRYLCKRGNKKPNLGYPLVQSATDRTDSGSCQTSVDG